MAVAMGVLAELDVADPVPLLLDRPALPHKSQQGFWCGAQAGDEVVGLTERLAAAGAAGDQLHDSSDASPALTDAPGCLASTQRPGRGRAVTGLRVLGLDGETAPVGELVADQPVQLALVAFHRQLLRGRLLLQHVGALGETSSNKDFVVGRASA